MKKYFIPVNLTINQLATVLTGSADNANSRIVKQACLLYTILCKDYTRLRLKGESNGYTQIKWSILAEIFGDNYAAVLELLINTGLLEINQVNPETGEFKKQGYYSIKSKTAKSYRIPASLRSGGCYQLVTIDKADKVILNKIDRLNGMTQDQQQLREYYRNFILSNMNKIVLLDNEYTRQMLREQCEKIGIEYTDDKATDYINTFNLNPFKFKSICLFGTRLHTEITNILKSIRKSFRFPLYLGSEFAEIDIVASQPWFLSIVNPALIKKFVPECSDAIPLFKQYDNHPDVLRFREKCANPVDGIYEAFRDAYNTMYGECFTRNDAKRICFRAFYTNYAKHEKLTLAKCEDLLVLAQQALADAQSHYEYVSLYGCQYQHKDATKILAAAKKRVKLAQSLVFSHKCITMFKKEFEGVYDLLAAIKLLKWDFERGTTTAYTKYYANPALLAQRIEASIVYTVVVRALIEAGINDVVTIHDSFCVRKEQEANARKVIKKAFNQLKLKPSLK